MIKKKTEQRVKEKLANTKTTIYEPRTPHPIQDTRLVRMCRGGYNQTPNYMTKSAHRVNNREETELLH